MPADHRTIEEQHRHIEAVAAPEERIGVDVHHLDRRQRHAPPEGLQLRQHLLAEVAVSPVDYGEDGGPFNAAAGNERTVRPHAVPGRWVAARDLMPFPPSPRLR